MKWKAFTILFIILLSLIPVYLLHKYLQKIIQPRQSMKRLFLYLFAGLLLIFGYSFVVVFIIKSIFPGA